VATGTAKGALPRATLENVLDAKGDSNCVARTRGLAVTGRWKYPRGSRSGHTKMWPCLRENAKSSSIFSRTALCCDKKMGAAD